MEPGSFRPLRTMSQSSKCCVDGDDDMTVGTLRPTGFGEVKARHKKKN